MKINFINYNGIEQYARVMYNDVKDSDKYKVEVVYNGKDIKALLEYLFSLENKIENAIDFCQRYHSLILEDFDTYKLLEKLLEILGDKE